MQEKIEFVMSIKSITFILVALLVLATAGVILYHATSKGAPKSRRAELVLRYVANEFDVYLREKGQLPDRTQWRRDFALFWGVDENLVGKGLKNQDPWGREIVVEFLSDNEITFRSLGPDLSSDGDDIVYVKKYQ